MVDLRVQLHRKRRQQELGGLQVEEDDINEPDDLEQATLEFTDSFSAEDEDGGSKIKEKIVRGSKRLVKKSSSSSMPTTTVKKGKTFVVRDMSSDDEAQPTKRAVVKENTTIVSPRKRK